jgi:PAS domain S-box-containing protein
MKRITIPMPKKVAIALQISFIYFILGVLWILTSDRLAVIFSQWVPLEKLQTYKGIFYILISAIVVYLLVHQSYKKLRLREREYYSLVQDQSDMIIRWQPQGNCLFANNAFLSFFNLKYSEMLGKDIEEVYPYENNLDKDQFYSQFSQENPILKHESVIQMPDNKSKHIEWTIHAFFNHDGRLTELQSVGRDITEHKKTQYLLKKSEEQLELALEGGSIGLWDYFPKSDRMEVNYRLISLLGYKEEEIKDSFQFWISMIHPDDLDGTMNCLTSHIKGEIPSFDVLHRVRHKNGFWLWVLSRGKVLEWNDKGEASRICGIIIDQTQSKEQELQRCISEKLHRELIENMSTAVVVCKVAKEGTEFIIEELNPAAEKSAQLDFAEVKGRSIVEVLPGLIPMGIYHVLQEVNSTGIPQKVINSKYVDDRLSLIIDYYAFKLQSGEIVVVYEDITEWMHSKEEIKKLNRDLEKRVQERTIQLESTNQELQSFAYSVSHDLRAPLRAIIGFSEAVIEDYAALLPESGVGYLNRVASEGKRMSLLIDDLLKLSRMNRHDIQFQSCNLSEIVQVAVERINGYYREKMPDIERIINIQENVVAKADLNLLTQAIENIVDNAFKFTSKNPIPWISFSCSIKDDRRIYCFEDNGVGFDMHYSDKVFSPFQRLHSVKEFEGSGIGLSIVKRVIVKHGGRIWCESEIGKGTKIFFTLGDFDF